MPYFEHNGANLYFELMGDLRSIKPPILLLHGNGESMEVFDDTIRPLLRRFPFIAMDSRGQGRSTVSENAPRISYEIMADDAFALLQYLGVQQCDILGFSDGAIIALMLAMNSDTRDYVRRLIAVGANTSPEGLKPAAIMSMKMERAHAKTDGDRFRYELFDMMLNQPNIPFHMLSNIYAQTAIVVGSRDMIKRSHSEAINDAIMHARLITINGADHFIPQNNPSRLREIMLEEFD